MSLQWPWQKGQLTASWAVSERAWMVDQGNGLFSSALYSTDCIKATAAHNGPPNARKTLLTWSELWRQPGWTGAPAPSQGSCSAWRSNGFVGDLIAFPVPIGRLSKGES